MNDPTLVALGAWANNCAETLGALLGQEAPTGKMESSRVTPTEMAAHIPGEVFHTTVTLSGGLMGPLVIGMDVTHAGRIAATMLGEEDAPSEFGDLHREIVGEALVQIASFLPATLEQATGRQVQLTSGESVVAMLPELGAPVYVVIDVPFELSKDGAIKLCLIMPEGLAEELTTAMEETGYLESLEAPPSDSESCPDSAAASGPEPGYYEDVEEESEDEELCGLDLIGDIPVEVTAILGKAGIMVEDLLTIGPGSVIELEKNLSDPVEVYVRDRNIAIGEVVVIDERFGISILRMVSEKKRPGIASGF